MKSNSLTIFVMTEKGYQTLLGINEIYLSTIELVVIGRDMNIIDDAENKIINFCLQSNIKFILKENFFKIETEYALAISWRWIINHEEGKLLVLHDSLLPRYRGFSPLVNSLINGEEKIGVTALFGSSKYDCGSIILQSSLSIKYPLKIKDAILKISRCYVEIINNILEMINSDTLIGGIIQDEKLATYSLWLDEDDYLINWNKSSSDIKRFIDATGYPYKGALSFLGNKAIRILDATEFGDVKIENRIPGKIIFMDENYPVIVCGRGLMKLTDLREEAEEGVTKEFKVSSVRSRFISTKSTHRNK